MTRRAVLCLALLAAGGPARAQAPREMTTDRPDVTESPFTVDPGHVQVEADWINFQRSGAARRWQALPLNLRLGLTRTLEAGIFVGPWTRARTGRGPAAEGFGDVVLRGKANFLGDDGGGPAWGLIADLKLPTADRALGNGRTEGDLALPFLIRAGSWEVAAMEEGEAHWSETRRDYRAGSLTTLSLGHRLAGPVDGYAELTVETGDGAAACTLDFGATWQATPDLQLDAGANLGLSRAAPDLLVFTGVARRF